MKKLSVLFDSKVALSFIVLFFIFTNHLTAQSKGDFRSKKNGLWTDVSIWQTYNGSTWGDAGNYPTYYDNTITIQNNITIQSITLNIDQVVINNGSSLSLTENAMLNLKNGKGVDLQNNGTLALNNTVNFDSDAVLLNDVKGTLNFKQTNKVSGKGTLINKNVLNIYDQLSLPENITCNQVSGMISGGGNLKIAGTLNASSGDIKVPLILSGGAVFNINSSSAKNLSSITNSGIINWNEGAINFYAGAVFTNNAQINIHNQCTLPDSLVFQQTSGTIAGNGNLKIAGTMNISSGDIKVPLIVSGGAVFNINSSSAKKLSSITNSGIINWNAGAINFYAGAVFTNNAQINLYNQYTLPDSLVFQQTSGTIAGNGNLKIAGTMNISSGDIKVALTIVKNAVLNINTTSAKSISSITNSGIVNWNAGDIGLHAGAVFTNSGRLSIYDQGSLSNADNIATTLNNISGGKIEKFASQYMETTIASDINNEGNILVHGGNLDTHGAFHNKHIFTLGKNTAFISEGTYYAEPTEIFRDSGHVANYGTMYINYNDTFPKTMDFDQEGILQGTGQLSVQGSIYLYGPCKIPVTITTTGICNSLLTDVYAPFTNNGVLHISDGTCNFYADFINNGLAQLANDFCTFHAGNSTAKFINNGQIKGGLAYPSTLIMYMPFTNSPKGSLNGIGTLRFEDTLINQGAINPGLKDPGQLPFSYGPFRNTSTTNIRIGRNVNNKTRADNVFVYYNGKTNIAGTLNLYQTTDIVDTGYYTIVGTYGLLHDTFTVGTFSVVNKPSNWDVVYTNNAVMVHVKAPADSLKVATSKEATSATANNSKFEVSYSIFPNPARDWVTVQFNAVKAGNFDMELYNTSGKRLQQKTGTISFGTNTIKVDVNGYAPEVYIINITDGDGHKKSLKFIKK